MNVRKWILIALAILAFAGIYLFRYYQEQAFVASLPKSTNLHHAFTPREGVQEATRIAMQWDRESFLQCVRIAFSNDPDNGQALSFEGRPIPPNGWMYRYFSPRRRRFLELILTCDGRCRAETSSAIDYLDSQPLPVDFLDSPEAFRIVDETYGVQFRKDVTLFRISAQLTTWPSNVGGPPDPVPHRPNWQIQYLATRTDKSSDHPHVSRSDLCTMSDAVTGKILTVMKYDGADVQIVFDAFANP